MRVPRMLRSCFSCFSNVQAREHGVEIAAPPVKGCMKPLVVNASESPKLVEKNLEERHVSFYRYAKVYEEDGRSSEGLKKSHGNVFERAVVILKQKRFSILDFKKYIHTFPVCNDAKHKDMLFVDPMQKLLRQLRDERETALEERTSGLSNDVLDNAVIALCQEVGRHMGVCKAQGIIAYLIKTSSSMEHAVQVLQDEISSIDERKNAYQLYLNDTCVLFLGKEYALKTLKQELQTAISELKEKERTYEYSDWNRIEQRRKGLAGTQLPAKITKKYWDDLPTLEPKSENPILQK